MSPLFRKSSFSYYLRLTILASQVLPVLRRQSTRPDFNADEAGSRTQQAWELYHLPYGTLGMISHAVMLWTMVCHLTGRKPGMPWQKLELGKVWLDVWNLAIIFITSVVTITLVTVGLPVVKGSRALTGLAVMQIIYSLVVDGIVVHRYFRDKPSNTGWASYGGPWAQENRAPEEERRGMGWDLAPWLVVLMVASVVNSQIMGTLRHIGRNPRLDGVTGHFGNQNDPTGVALVICAMVGGVLAFIAPVALYCCGAIGSNRDGRGRLSSFAVHLFVFLGVTCCVGFIMAADYAVGVVVGNSMGSPRMKGSSAKFWTFFVFQFLPVFTF